MAELLLRKEPDGRLGATIVGWRPPALMSESEAEVHEVPTLLRPDDRRQRWCREARSRSEAHEDQRQAETFCLQLGWQMQCLSRETTCDW